MLPASNATLLKLTAPGTADDYDVQGTPGSAIWAGVEGCYVVSERDDRSRRAMHDSSAGEQRDKLVKTYVVVNHARALQAEDGGTVKYTFEGETSTRQIDRIEQHRIAGTGRLWLRDQ